MKTRAKFLNCLVSAVLAVAVLLPPGSSMAAATSSAWLDTGIQQVSEVWVDDDFTVGTPGWGVDHFATIQEGVDAVAPGGSVEVAAGTYTGQIVIDRDLSLHGENKTSVIFYENELQTCGGGVFGDRKPVICILDDASVTIEGFTIQQLDGIDVPDEYMTAISISNSGGSDEDKEETFIEIFNNTIEFPENFIGTRQDTAGIDVYAGYDSSQLSINIHHNEISGFNQGLFFHLCNFYYAESCSNGNYSSIEVVSNNLMDNGIAITFSENISASPEIHFNRIYSRFTNNRYYNSPAGMIVAPLAEGMKVNAEKNWWGCNEGPWTQWDVQTSCVFLDVATEPWDQVLDVDPWLIFTLNPPTPIAVGQTARLSADLLHVIGGELASGGVVSDGIEVSFSATTGSLDPDKAGTLNGEAATTYHADATSDCEEVCAFLLDGEQKVCQYIQVHDEPLTLNDLRLLISSNGTDWEDVPGNFAEGFEQLLDPSVEFYYLDAADLVTTHPLEDGLYPFYFGQVPDEFFDYWAGRGVIEGATGWQGVMWEIINGREPIFYLEVSGAEVDLIDGLLYALGQGDQPLRIDGDYLTGEYTFSGEVEDLYGFTDQVTVGVTFYDPLALTDLDLLVSTDKVDWQAVPGSIATGFGLALDPSVEYFYLDAENVDSNRPLADGYHAFYVDTYPVDYFAYWAGRGVVEGATGWQGVMWEIINGEKPIFYLKVSSAEVDLIDGLLYALGQGDQPLRIDGDYLPGEYTFSGEIEDDLGSSESLLVGITFNDIPAGEDQNLTTDEEKTLKFTLTAIDQYHPEGLAWIVGRPQHGTLSGTAPALTYTPDENWHGTDSFTFSVSDGELVSAFATVTITVNPVNDAPEAATLTNVEWLARQAHALVIPAFTDVDGDELTYTATLGDGSALPAWLTFDPATRTLSATPNNTHVGTYVIKVTASDGKEQVSASFTLKVILNPFMIYMPIIGR
jgi:hypothetical protein